MLFLPCMYVWQKWQADMARCQMATTDTLLLIGQRKWMEEWGRSHLRLTDSTWGEVLHDPWITMTHVMITDRQQMCMILCLHAILPLPSAYCSVRKISLVICSSKVWVCVLCRVFATTSFFDFHNLLFLITCNYHCHPQLPFILESLILLTHIFIT